MKKTSEVALGNLAIIVAMGKSLGFRGISAQVADGLITREEADKLIEIIAAVEADGADEEITIEIGRRLIREAVDRLLTPESKEVV